MDGVSVYIQAGSHLLKGLARTIEICSLGDVVRCQDSPSGSKATSFVVLYYHQSIDVELVGQFLQSGSCVVVVKESLDRGSAEPNG